MSNIWDRVQTIWNAAKAGPARQRACFMIPAEPVQTFEPKQHYVQVVLNEMYLANTRQWFTEYAPVTIVATTYQYGRKNETAPTLVGPSMLQKFVDERVPTGTIIRNAPVTGLHPYQGGPITLTVFFNRVQQINNADNVLGVLENIVTIADPLTPAIPFASYLKIAGHVMAGFEKLMNLSQTVPLMAYRETINPDIGQILQPGHLVLIDADGIDQDKFFVRESKLVYGDSLETAEPYRENDFLMLEIAQGVKRSDEATLPFYPIWEKTIELALQSGEDEFFWQEAKAHFNTLKRQMIASPDLTRPDYARLRKYYLDELKRHRQEAAEDAHLGLDEKALDLDEEEMRQLANELDELDEL